MRIVTWNMQGGTDSVSSKWTLYVTQFFLPEIEADVVCLQECGALPGNVSTQAPPAWIGAIPSGTAWQSVLWTPLGRSFHVLWVNTDPAGNRVNLALVAPAAPGAFVYAAPGLPSGRPAIGMRFNTTDIFTLHAFAMGGGDAAGLITSINATVGPPWYAAGDFNREPATWVPPAGNLWPPDQPTYPSSRKELDYIVTSAFPVRTGTVLAHPISDHYPVVYDV